MIIADLTHKLILTFKTINNIPEFIFDYLHLIKGDILYQIRNTNLKVVCRGGTPDKEEVVVNLSGDEYHLPKINKKNITIVDIGAHIGTFSLYVTSFFKNSKIHIVAIEPDPINYYYLQKNIQINHLTNIKAIQQAISSKNGQAYLENTNTTNDRYHLTENSNKNNCKTQTLNTLILSNKIKYINILKMDIEGAEFEVLTNKTIQFLAEINDYLLLEIHPNVQTVDKLTYSLKKFYNLLEVHKNVWHFQNRILPTVPIH
jgi:FkbM family methyltransferase